ncbi:MAG: glutaminase [Myxococcota bacterium]
MNYGAILEEVARALADAPKLGEVATYIPELGSVDPDKFGLALHCTDGSSFAEGDADERFSVQSVAKVLALAWALSLDAESVWRRVGVEPSGDPFNSLVQLEYERGRPRNPLINAGALVVCDILFQRTRHAKDEFRDFVRTVSAIDDVDYDPRVAESERRTAYRNQALLNLMRDFGNIESDLDEVLDFYVHVCALEMSCRELAQAFLFMADHGRCLPAGKRKMLTREQTKRINAVMLTCGFYDEAGEFAFRVGLPGKSGVGGGIVAVCPDRFTAAAWSPRLGRKGNSILGTEALALLARKTDSSIF